MSVCKYQPLSPGSDQWSNSIAAEHAILQDKEWNMLSIVDMIKRGSSFEAIQSSVPFRRHTCRRTIKCCGVCTRQCKNRCIQDCLHRLYMWRKVVEGTNQHDREQLPLGIRMIVTQQFDTAEGLATAIGEILSVTSNSELRQFMEEQHFKRDHPYKINYGPQPVLNMKTGKRMVNPETGEIKFRWWPESGLCPFCMPDVEVDTRFGKRGTSNGSTGL